MDGVELKFFRLSSMNEFKMDNLARHMLEDPLHVSDEYRTPLHAYQTIYNCFSGDPQCGTNVAMEIGNDGGYLIFADIIPEFKCRVGWVAWDFSIFGHKMVREAKDVFDTLAKVYNLLKMETKTPDERVVKLSRLIGFEVEGVLRNSFMQNGALLDVYVLGKNWR